MACRKKTNLLHKFLNMGLTPPFLNDVKKMDNWYMEASLNRIKCFLFKKVKVLLGFFIWQLSMKVNVMPICEYFRKWASKCEVLFLPRWPWLRLYRLAGFHFQVTLNGDYSWSLLIWVVDTKFCVVSESKMALLHSGVSYLFEKNVFFYKTPYQRLSFIKVGHVCVFFFIRKG